MPRTRAALTIGDWEKLADSIDEETTGGALHLQIMHKQLQGFLDEFQQLVVEQKRLDAQKQAATRRMNEILEEGRRTASALRLSLKQHLGVSNEQLVQFGIQPFRSRKRRKTTEIKPEGGGSQSSGEPLT